MQVVVDSLLTQYERAGKGKTVLILHGWADNSKGWRQAAERLSKYFELIVVDLPGFGGSQTPLDTWGLDNYAAFVGKFLKAIRAEPFGVIAHSNGGAIALRGLAEGMFQTERLVLVDSTGIRSEYTVGYKKAHRLVTKAGKVLTRPLPAGVKKQLRRKAHQSMGSGKLVVARLQETFKKIVTDDVQSNAAVLQVPALLIYGEDDLEAPVQYGRMLHNLIAGSQLEVVPGAGHFPHLDKPDHVLPLIEEFLQQ